MKMIMICGSLLAIGMLVMLPSISAVEYKSSAGTNNAVLIKALDITQQKKLTLAGGTALFVPMIIILLLLWIKGTKAGNPFGAPACPFVIPPP